MRLLVLYLRSRQVPMALAATAGTVAILWSLGQGAGTGRVNPMLGSLAVLAGVIVAGQGLAGADVDLDRTAAIAWGPRRTAHVLAIGAAVVGICTATELLGDRLAPAGQVTRDAAGMCGLIALGAATLGATRSWIAPLAWQLLAWTLVSTVWPPPFEATYQTVLTWMHQPGSSTPATVTAAVLGGTGTLVYAVAGPRP